MKNYVKVLFNQNLNHYESWLADTTGIVEVRKIEVLQEQAQSILNEYIKNMYPPGEATVRYGRLLLAVSLLKMVRADTIETLFFKETVGDTSVMRLLQVWKKVFNKITASPESSMFFCKDPIDVPKIS